MPVGLTGELVIAGVGVVSGYLDQPKDAPSAFLEDPFGAGRAFATGQVARWRSDGQLELAHRPRPTSEGLASPVVSPPVHHIEGLDPRVLS